MKQNGRKQNIKWRKLDNAAKIFPPTSSNKDPKVFRFVCELYENVDKTCLEKALKLTLKRFPFFQSVLKKGIFWYYFEDTQTVPEVFEEHKPPCSPIYDPNNKKLLFEVTYYKRRINLEVFHALSDGAGAIQFLRALVINYLNLKYKSSTDLMDTDDYNVSKSQMTLDGFDKYFSEIKVKKTKSEAAYRFKGRKHPNYQTGIVELIVPLSKIKDTAKGKNLTITEYLTVLLIDSIGENMTVRDRKKPVSISIPVNLRTYFPSKTSQNFFSVINLHHNFDLQSTERDAITENVKEFFRTNLTKEYLQERINLFASLENKLPAKLLPLFIKIPSLKIANIIADKGVTAAFSNVGQIELPAEAETYVKRFSVFTSTQKLQITMCSFKDDMTISFTSPFADTEVHCSFLDRLNEIEDLTIEINSNLNYLDYR